MGIEAALLGTGLSATTAGTATAGLLGSGGLLFGIEGLTASAIMSGLGTLATIGSAGASILGGIQSSQEAAQQSEYALASATMAGREASRQAAAQAAQEKQSYQDTIRKQKIAYLSSGVELEGTPLTTMAATKAKGESNVEEILSAGASRYASVMTEGVLASQKAKSAGRSALLSGLTSGVGQLLAKA